MPGVVDQCTRSAPVHAGKINHFRAAGRGLTLPSMRRTLAILGICAALSACSSGGGSTAVSTKGPAAASAGVPATSASSDGAAAPGTAAAGGAVAPCAVVTTSDVAAAFGGTVAPGVVNPDNGGCDYVITGKTKTGDSGTLTQVSIEFSSGYETYDHTKVIFPDIEKIDGLGQEAWYEAFGSQLHINLGAQELVISGVFPGDKTAVKADIIAFAHTVTGKL